MKTNNTTMVLASVGALAGLYFAFNKKKGFWGYAGYFVLGSVAGHLAGNIVGAIIPQPKTEEFQPTIQIQGSTKKEVQSGVNRVQGRYKMSDSSNVKVDVVKGDVKDVYSKYNNSYQLFKKKIV